MESSHRQFDWHTNEKIIIINNNNDNNELINISFILLITYAG